VHFPNKVRAVSTASRSVGGGGVDEPVRGSARGIFGLTGFIVTEEYLRDVLRSKPVWAVIADIGHRDGVGS
jgi:hypothetical protein